MFALGRFGIILGLSTIRDILGRLGNPQNSYKCIHIAGTNGKGSIASSLSSILSECGYRVGLFTSPHLIDFNERICINNTPISNDEVVNAYLKVHEADIGERKATFFELSTAMALYEFKRQNVEWAVVETGMGGRLDATNIVQPEISVISNISLEHKMYLGNTISEIAGEKAGIIKKNIPVITGAKQKNAIDKIESIARSKNAPLFRLGKNFKVRKSPKGSFTYMGISETHRNMVTSLKGDHQIQNAAITIATCETLKKQGANITFNNIRQGLIKNKWPGRLETVSTNPLVIIDGAHNLAAIRNLARYLKRNVTNKNMTLVTGILDDKPFETMLKSLIPICSRVILTRPDNERSTDPKTLLPIARKIIENITIIEDVDKAVKYAIENSGPDDAVCISGSLYLVGEAKAALQN